MPSASTALPAARRRARAAARDPSSSGSTAATEPKASGRGPVDREDEARLAALELDRRAVGFGHHVVRSEALQHPPDRRRPIRCAPGVDRTRDDQPVDRTGHRDVVQTQPLGLLLVARGVAHLLEPEHRLWLAAGRVHHAEPEAPVRERDDLVRPRGPATSRPASATITTLNSSPFAAWIVSRRTAPPPSSSATASSSLAPSASCSRTKRTKPAMSAPRIAS